MSGINIPSDSTHLSDQERADLIDHFGGVVDSQFVKRSMMRKFVNVRPVRGTDTLVDRRIGKTAIVGLTPGVRPPATPTPQGKVSVTVDTVVLARDNQSLLNTFQSDFNVRKELGTDHGKNLGKYFDESLLIAAVKSSATTNQDTLNGAFGPGTTTTLASAGDETDPDALYEAIAAGVVQYELQDIDTDECAIFVNPTQYDVLMNNDKLLSRDYSSSNGDFADGKVMTLKGVPIVMTNRLPQAAVTGHILSNATNGNFYDVSAAEANVTALIMHPKSILVGETIPLTSDVYFDKVEKQWFIDSWLSYGAGVNRSDTSYAIRKV